MAHPIRFTCKQPSCCSNTSEYFLKELFVITRGEEDRLFCRSPSFPHCAPSPLWHSSILAHSYQPTDGLVSSWLMLHLPPTLRQATLWASVLSPLSLISLILWPQQLNFQIFILARWPEQITTGSGTPQLDWPGGEIQGVLFQWTSP